MTYEEFFREWDDVSADILCHTSGSTGKPRDILLPKNEMMRSAMRTIRHFNLDRRSHLHSCISPDYIGGKMQGVRAKIMGAEFTYETPSNRPLEHYRGGRIDLLSVVPSQMRYILDHADEMPEIGAILIGGAPIPINTEADILKSKFNVWETYGMTETASHIALRNVKVFFSPFRAFDDIQLSIDSDRRLIINIVGWKRVVTNDVVDIHGNQFKGIGRYDNVINSGGIKIHPEPIEQIMEGLLRCPVLITSAPDDKWGERVVMVVEDSGLYPDDQIVEICREHLQKKILPKEIRHGKIPRTENGKKRRKL